MMQKSAIWAICSRIRTEAAGEHDEPEGGRAADLEAYRGEDAVRGKEALRVCSGSTRLGRRTTWLDADVLMHARRNFFWLKFSKERQVGNRKRWLDRQGALPRGQIDWRSGQHHHQHHEETDGRRRAILTWPIINLKQLK